MAKSFNNNRPPKSSINELSLAIGKKPPQALDLEEAVLGAIMLEQNAFIDLQGILKPESFYKEAHQKIYGAIQRLSANHDPIDLLTVTEDLSQHGELEDVGGATYLVQLTQRIGSGAHAEYHAKIVAQKFIQRELIRISSDIQKKAFDEASDVNDLLDQAQQDIFQLAEGNIRKEVQRVSIIVKEALEEIETASARSDGFSGTPSGFTSIDRVTLGWQPSDMIIVAARPSMGKTAFVLSMARNMAVGQNIPVAFFSLEMSSVQLIKRLMVSESGISSEKIRSGRLSPDDWTQLDKSIKDLIEAPLFIDDTPALSIFEFRAKARRLVATQKIKAIVIDYLQLMTGPPDLKGLREQEVSAISRSLKAIAKELNIPILALSQLNRSVETRTGNKRPQLSDLRESGAIEQDADLVLFIHRPEYYGITQDELGNSLAGIAEIIIAKHRNGAVGDVQLRFAKEQAKFYDLDDQEFDQLKQQEPTQVIYKSKMNDDTPSYEQDFSLNIGNSGFGNTDVPF